MKQCRQLSLISENLVCHLSKNITEGTVVELFSTLHFSVKHGGSVTATSA